MDFDLQTLRSFVNERLCAAAEEICVVVERIITQYEEQEAFSSKQHIERIMDVVLKPDITLHRAEGSLDQQERNTIGLFQEDPDNNTGGLIQEEPGGNTSGLVQECPQIKEEQDDLLHMPKEAEDDNGLTLGLGIANNFTIDTCRMDPLLKKERDGTWTVTKVNEERSPPFLAAFEDTIAAQTLAVQLKPNVQRPLLPAQRRLSTPQFMVQVAGPRDAASTTYVPQTIVVTQPPPSASKPPIPVAPNSQPPMAPSKLPLAPAPSSQPAVPVTSTKKVPYTTLRYRMRKLEEEARGKKRRRYTRTSDTITCHQCQRERDPATHNTYYGNWYCQATATTTLAEWRAKLHAENDYGRKRTWMR